MSFHAEGKPELSRGRLALVYSILAGTWVTGVGWLVLHYFLRRQGELGMTPSPAEPWALELHGACAFGALWLSGWLWATHVAPNWRQDRRRPSGIVVLAVLTILAVTGYLLYYLGNEQARTYASMAHWAIGLATPLPLLVHALWRRGSRQRDRSNPSCDGGRVSTAVAIHGR